MSQTGLQDFNSTWKEYRRLWLGLASASIPFVAAFSGVAPPWPKYIAPLTAVFQLLVVMYVYQTQINFSKEAVTKKMRGAAFIFALPFFVYVFVFSQFAVFIPGRGEYLVTGFQCTNKALQLYADICPYLGLNELGDARYNEYELWTRSSISTTRTGLLALWCLFFVGLSAFIGSFIVFQRRRQVAVITAK